MKNIEPLAYRVRHYTGQNPFKYSQARDFPLQKLNDEFVPTPKFWNRFNVSNEILIGTRGSGKTILLRMMTYSSQICIANGPFGSQLKSEVWDHGISYIGFYIPLRLRVLREIGTTDNEEEERRRFSFLFNCVAASAIIDEVHTIIRQKFQDDVDALMKERELINKLKFAWGIALDERTPTLRYLQETIDRLFDAVRTNWDFQKGNHTFDSALLEPIISILPVLNNIFGFDRRQTSWVACFDEAEYLNENLQRVLNTVMRSESRGLAVKIATLPFHYNEFRTETDDEYVQAEGDDFRFESIDYQWNESDFIELTDYLVGTRLAQTRLFDDEFPEKLESFVGETSNKDLTALYKNVFPNVDENAIREMVISELRLNAQRTTQKFSDGQIKKYIPIFLIRELYAKTRNGNSKVPLLSGASMIRKVSDGNVRRFLQICDALFESSRASLLKPNSQHDVVWKFAEQRFSRSQSVYGQGFLLHNLLLAISNFLFHKLHNGPISDVGVEFTIAESLLKNKKITVALEMGVAYSYLTCPQTDLFNGISSSTRFRLSNAIAAFKWLPMRAGSGMNINEHSEIIQFLHSGGALEPKVTEVSKKNLELDLF